ncbi:MAG: hypothetical protein PHW73_00130 [Atribacterota bacterium]|nr:hypothetical protein [Atribacterota bacterium]
MEKRTKNNLRYGQPYTIVLINNSDENVSDLCILGAGKFIEECLLTNISPLSGHISVSYEPSNVSYIEFLLSIIHSPFVIDQFRMLASNEKSSISKKQILTPLTIIAKDRNGNEFQ